MSVHERGNVNELGQCLDQDEAFEVGREQMQARLQALGCSVDSAHQRPQVEQMANLSGSDEALVAAYWLAYFGARLKIEQSYDFIDAKALFAWGEQCLAKVSDAALRPQDCVCLHHQLAVASVDVDRGMHNNAFAQCADACREQLSWLAETAACQSQLSAWQAYLQAMLVLSETLQRRDQGQGVSEADWDQVESDLYQAWLKNRSQRVFASMLRAHWASVATLRQPSTDKLVIHSGQWSTAFYATLNALSVDCLSGFLQDAPKRLLLEQALGAEAFYQPEPADVLSDLSLSDPFRLWQFDLPSVRVSDFRGDALTLALSVRLNNLGSVQCLLQTDLDGMDVNALRHLNNLPLENAVDERMQWRDHAYAYLREIADEVFAMIRDWLGHAQALQANTSEHVATSVLIEQFCTLQSQRPLSFAQAQAHGDWQGLTTPPREVRSHFENWRLQQPHAGVGNLGADLYHQHNWVQADGHFALLVMLDQPSWVTDQALENVQVATSARYYFQQLHQLLFERLQRYQARPFDDSSLSDVRPSQLRAQADAYRAQIRQLHDLNQEVKKLVHLMDSGGLMRFPDHNRFIQTLFQAVGVNAQQTRLQAILAESRETIGWLQERVHLAVDKIQQQASERMNLVMGVVGVLLSVSALSDLFGMLKGSGVSLPPFLEIEITVGLMALIIVYFLVETLLQRRK
ncbi:MAG: hypothetical protein RI556_04580 [Hydrogenovibrio sp.]|uniref:hypothetical protein n=1 Tax=Hydrogenovibrio sp. TaxID=2065821 RepID=UPI00286FBB06|nr:hypothetical protein [Hydrogenovibrio sp.]MDR9498431.1 hypothetical protein [Hydrogenovibrio sp.]